MSQIILIILAFLVGTVSDSAHARKPKVETEPVEEYLNKDIQEGATVWHCWYGGTDTVLCRLGEAVPAGINPPVSSLPRVDSRLPAIVKKIWQSAADVADTLISIPLHTIPYDWAFTGQLVESVMCGGASKPCGIIFAKNTVTLSELVQRRGNLLAARKIGSLALND